MSRGYCSSAGEEILLKLYSLCTYMCKHYIPQRGDTKFLVLLPLVLVKHGNSTMKKAKDANAMHAGETSG